MKWEAAIQLKPLSWNSTVFPPNLQLKSSIFKLQQGWDQSDNSKKKPQNKQKQSNFLWFTPDSLFQRDLLVPNGLPLLFSTWIPCQKISWQCHHLQPSNNDVPSSLLYSCKAKSFTQENKFKWPIGKACFGLILKKRLKKKSSFICHDDHLKSSRICTERYEALRDLANKCQSCKFTRNRVTPKLLTS